MKSNKIETEATTVIYYDGLLTIRSKGIRSTQASVENTLGAAASLVGDKRGPILFDARDWPGGDPEGWQSVVAQIGHLFTAAAMLVDPAQIDGIGPFPKVIDRLVIPFGTFDDEPSAIAFLDQYRDRSDSAI